MKYLGYSELTKRLYVPKRSSIPHGKIDITDDVEEYINMLKQSENVQASVATGDGGNKCNPHGHNLDVRYQSVCSNCGGTQLADADNRFVASNQTPVKECYVPIDRLLKIIEENRQAMIAAREKEYDVIEIFETENIYTAVIETYEFVSETIVKEKVTLPVTDWKKLEEKFFNECCFESETLFDRKIYTEINFRLSPQDVWNWFKSNIK